MAVSLTFVPRLPFGALVELRGLPGPPRNVDRVPAFFGAGPAVASSRGSPPPLPLGWEKHTHPEGVNYFSQPSTGILTPVDPRMRRNRDRLELAFRDIRPRLPQDAQPGADFHIMLGFTQEELEDGVVQYYLVDYNFRIIYWVHPVDVRGIGLRQYPTFACLRSMLLPHFWTHVDHFPATTPLDIEVATRDLTRTLNLGRRPVFPSLTPWAQDECTLHLEALAATLTGPSHYRMATLGRLNSILSKHWHSLRWDINNNPIPFLPRGGANDPAVPVPQRAPEVERGQHPLMASRLASFLIFSTCMVIAGMPLLWDEFTDRVAFSLTIGTSLLLCLLTPVLNTLQNFDPPLSGVLVGRPWLACGLLCLTSFNLGLYVLLVDDAAHLLMDPNINRVRDGVVRVVLTVVLPPLLTTFTLAWVDRNPRLPPL